MTVAEMYSRQSCEVYKVDMETLDRWINLIERKTDTVVSPEEIISWMIENISDDEVVEGFDR